MCFNTELIVITVVPRIAIAPFSGKICRGLATGKCAELIEDTDTFFFFSKTGVFYNIYKYIQAGINSAWQEIIIQTGIEDSSK